MAQIEGLQVNILANISQLEKALSDAKKALASVGEESKKQADNISNPLKGAADAIGSKYGWMAGEIATKLASLANPAALAATAVTAIGAALLAYFNNIGEKTTTIDESLKKHGDLIKAIKQSYGEASAGLENYARDSNAVLEALNRGSIDTLKKQLISLANESLAAFTTAAPATSQWSRSIDLVAGSVVLASRSLIPFRDAIADYNYSIQAGQPDLKRYREAIADLMNASKDNQSIQDLGNKLLDASNKAFTAAGTIGQAGRAMQLLSSDAQNSANALTQFNKLLDETNRIAPAQVDERKRAKEIYVAMRQVADGRHEAALATQVYNDTMKRLDEQDAKRNKPSAVKVDNSEAELRREQESIAKRLETLNLGWGTEEEQLAAHLVRNQDLINLANQKKVTDDETHKILMAGAEEEYQKKMEGLRMAGINSALTATGEVFGAMARVVQSGGKKNVRLAKMFGVAEAIIATMVAANKAMAVSATGGPAAAFAAWAAVAAKGLATVAAIRSVSESGGGGSAAGAASGGGGGGGGAAAADGGGAAGRGPGGNSVYINLQGQSFGRDQVRDLVKQIADFQKDGGQVVFA
jgi:hypothetical protein